MRYVLYCTALYPSIYVKKISRPLVRIHKRNEKTTVGHLPSSIGCPETVPKLPADMNTV